MRAVEIWIISVPLFVAIGLLIVSSIRDYRATGKVAWWWPTDVQMAIFSRRFFENYPDQRFSRKELRWVRRITWSAVALIVLAVLYLMIAVAVATPSEAGSSQFLNIVVYPALIAFGSGIFILLLRGFLWMFGYFGSDR